MGPTVCTSREELFLPGGAGLLDAPPCPLNCLLILMEACCMESQGWLSAIFFLKYRLEEEERVKIRREKVSSPRHRAMPWHSSCPVLKLSLLVSGAMRQAILAPWAQKQEDLTKIVFAIFECWDQKLTARHTAGMRDCSREARDQSKTEVERKISTRSSGEIVLAQMDLLRTTKKGCGVRLSQQPQEMDKVPEASCDTLHFTSPATHQHPTTTTTTTPNSLSFQIKVSQQQVVSSITKMATPTSRSMSSKKSHRLILHILKTLFNYYSPKKSMGLPV
ncbi:hypothetical protein INR49_017083 [Caranx melampygus]|nr:hypothetical protein INR49_017083 [Caranx melampygus]